MQNQPKENKEIISETEQYRRDIYSSKRQELEKELSKYEYYCNKSRDLEHLLRLHNFLLKNSFKKIKATYDEFMNNTSKEATEEEVSILQKTFDLLFIDNAIDFYNEISVRGYIGVHEKFSETKENYQLFQISVLYKGQEKEQLVLDGQQLQDVIEDINQKNIKYEDLASHILSHPVFIERLSNVLYQTLLNPNSSFNTIHFQKNSSKEIKYFNASDFKNAIGGNEFKKYLQNLDDAFIQTTLLSSESQGSSVGV